MPLERTCDFCSLTEEELPSPQIGTIPKLSQDEDGLWICFRCQESIQAKPIGKTVEMNALADELKPLVGKSAGAICRTLELPFEPPYQIVIEAASKIAYDLDQYMSAWLFEDLWLDGTTQWRSESRNQIALVYPDGTITIQ